MEVAIVIVKDQEKQKEVQQEVEVLQMVSGHQNIVDFYGAYYHQASRTPSPPEGLWIATEFITGATLQDLIGTTKHLGERWISYICKHIITGLFHLQKKNIIHHDIKPGNILITSFGEVKIGEFGFATVGAASSSTSRTTTYMAPEVLANFGNNKLEYDHKVL
uniref:Protein kinase domain-containing protein n=1 Tax=Xenopus tropicalis TaxID=8364 RepID=A0A803J9D5_XENTR